MLLGDLGLDKRIVEIFARKDITGLYPPQEEALVHVLEGHNTVLAVPTASGKSLVAYIAVLRAVLDGKKALYIVPLRALASEKYDDLKEFEELGIKVGKTVGDFDAPEMELKEMDVIVATSERADSLVRHKTDWMYDIGVVVADEVHLMNDPNRGPTLEVTLVRLRALNPSTQFIALSATIRNSIELADWLDARHVHSDWRPVELKEGIFFNDVITFMDNSVKDIEVKGDPIASLVLDTLKDHGQILVFVNTRRSSESVAERVSKAMGKVLSESKQKKLGELAERIGSCEEEPTSVGARLAHCVENGSAFHNAGLTNVQRKLVEANFLDGNIKAIVATPTLAAGINLTAADFVSTVEGAWSSVTSEGMTPLAAACPSRYWR